MEIIISIAILAVLLMYPAGRTFLVVFIALFAGFCYLIAPPTAPIHDYVQWLFFISLGFWILNKLDFRKIQFKKPDLHVDWSQTIWGKYFKK